MSDRDAAASEHRTFASYDAPRNSEDADDLWKTSTGGRGGSVARQEVERLLDDEKLVIDGTASSEGSTVQTSRAKNKRRSHKSDRGRRQGSSEHELLYKAEEGERSSSAESSASSSEVDLRRIQTVHAKRKSRASRCGRFAALHVVIIVAFLALLYGAYRASHPSTTSSTSRPSVARVLSNGTHEFGPTTILISLDGFRADFLHRGLTPTLSSFVKQGVSPKYMMPSFPSLTFPNHFTLVTGLYPEAHGIVGNTFWDPNLQKEFWYTDPDRSMHPEWWNAEPLWETAELQGIRSAIHMWPGSEAHIGTLEPAYVDKFKGDEALDRKVNRILGWLDTPGPNDPGASPDNPRPQLIAAYVPDVDSDGHLYGPNSTYIRSTIREVDGMLGSLFEGLNERNLTDIVNVIVVSDHGMATTSNHRLVQLEDLINVDEIEHIDGWPLYGLRPKDPSDAQLKKIYQQLLDKAQEPKYKGNFDVYLRDENMPARYHFSNNDRIAPLWIVPKVGWAIVTKDEFDLETALERNEVYHPRGLHGYDHEHPLMRAIFIARGPAFPHPQGSQVHPFQNTELYNIVCDSLGLEPVPNNGTLRLPLKPNGLHDFDAQVEPLEDFDEPDTGAQLLPPELPGVNNLPQPPLKTDGSTSPSTTESADFPPERPVVEDGAPQDEHDRTWSEWINEQLASVKVWASGLFGGDKDHPKEAEDTRHGEDW